MMRASSPAEVSFLISRRTVDRTQICWVKASRPTVKRFLRISYICTYMKTMDFVQLHLYTFKQFFLPLSHNLLDLVNAQRILWIMNLTCNAVQTHLHPLKRDAIKQVHTQNYPVSFRIPAEDPLVYGMVVLIPVQIFCHISCAGTCPTVLPHRSFSINSYTTHPAFVMNSRHSTSMNAVNHRRFWISILVISRSCCAAV